MKTLETKTTKAGKTVYYLVGDDGKKKQISSAKAQDIINGNTEEENKMASINNTVAIMNATADDMEAAIRAEEDAMERIELADNAEHKPQCSWENPHNYETVGNLDHARILYTKEPAAKKARKKTTPAEQQQRWLSNAKINESGQYYVVPELTYKNMNANKGWNPCFYILTNDYKLTRIGLKFAIELAKAGKAVELGKDGIKELKKAA